MAAPEVLLRRLDDLTPDPDNARTHSAEQIAMIEASIRRFGWTSPMLVDDVIRAGNGRFEAARMIYGAGDSIFLAPGRERGGAKLPAGTVPVIDCSGWTVEERAAYALADNQLALQAGWDEDRLRATIEHLAAADFDIPVIGFDQAALDALAAPPGPDLDPDDAPDVPDDPVSRRGDIWLCGHHRVMCGSSTDRNDIEDALGGLTIDLVNSDPPYGLNVVKGAKIGGAKPFGKVHGVGQSGFKGRVHGPARRAIIQPGTYHPVIGDESNKTALDHHAVLTAGDEPLVGRGGVIVLWGGNYYAGDPRRASDDPEDQPPPIGLPPSRCWLVWDKENSGSFADAELAWTNQDRVVKLIRHQWNGLMKASERGERRVHPTQKPVALAEWVIEQMCPDGKVVFDGFLGSGSTLIAAENKGVVCVGIEMSEAYVDVVVRRWQRYTGGQARLLGQDRIFDDIANERLSPEREPA